MKTVDVAELERSFAVAQEIGFGVATSGPDSALHLALLVAGVAEGQDVAVPSYSPVLVADTVRGLGARPLFADVDPLTRTVTPTNLRAALTQRTRAVVAVDLGGVPVDLDELRTLCDAKRVVVVEYAADALGATYRGRPVGAGADLTVWSLADGAGGLVTTSHPGLADRLRAQRQDPMTDAQAEAGLAQLDDLADTLARRREVAARYTRALAAVDGLRPVTDPAYGVGSRQSCWVEVLPTHPLTRDQLLARLETAGLPGLRGTRAIHRLDEYAATYHRPLPVTEHLDDTVLVLPLTDAGGEPLTTARQDVVIDVLDVLLPGTPA